MRKRTLKQQIKEEEQRILDENRDWYEHFMKEHYPEWFERKKKKLEKERKKIEKRKQKRNKPNVPPQI